MGRFFITGSSDGLGLYTAQRLVQAGHEVVLHARNAQRAQDARAACPGARAVLTADLASLDETKRLAADAARLGPYAAVLHNAGVCDGQEFVAGPAGWPVLFTVNTVAPYVLVARMPRAPGTRILLVSSERHLQGQPRLADLAHAGYDDSKLQTVLLSKYFARRFRGRGVAVHALSPGWVPTKMGGAGARDTMASALDTFVGAMLGTGPSEAGDTADGPTGLYLEKSAVAPAAAVTDDEAVQDALVAALAEMSGVVVEE